jgi:hypothetical protein
MPAKRLFSGRHRLLLKAQRRTTMEWLIALIVLIFGIPPFLFWLIAYYDKIGIEKPRTTHG